MYYVCILLISRRYILCINIKHIRARDKTSSAGPVCKLMRCKRVINGRMCVCVCVRARVCVCPGKSCDGISAETTVAVVSGKRISGSRDLPRKTLTNKIYSEKNDKLTAFQYIVSCTQVIIIKWFKIVVSL